MTFKPLKHKHQELRLVKPARRPDFLARTVLVEDPWDYVALWLKREGHDQARFFWQQAEDFYNAAMTLPSMSSPVPAYYCMLNAAKTLLSSQGVTYRPIHGVRGRHEKGRWSLAGERIELDESGVIPALCTYFGEPHNGVSYNLQNALYNLPWIHRAYVLTYTTSPELFIPLEKPCYVTRDGADFGWFCARVCDNWATGHTTKKLPTDYARTDEANSVYGQSDYVVRRRSTFPWHHGVSNETKNIAALTSYHRDVRRQAYYIRGPKYLWYLKRDDRVVDVLNRSSITLTITAMHRVSEMSRYDPLWLHKHLEEHHHNWLLSVFIRMAPTQFVDEVASEITGREFMPPGIRG